MKDVVTGTGFGPIPVTMVDGRDIVRFEMEVAAWRPTLNLSQNKTPAQREGVIAGLEASGALAMATMMRGQA